MGFLSWWWGVSGIEQRCVLCHDYAVSDGLCLACAADVLELRIDPSTTCPSCASMSTGGVGCGKCQQRPPPFERLWTSVYYAPPISSMIYAFKHRADLSMLLPLGRLMLAHPPPWLGDVNIDTVLAVPLSKERRLFRGFNQSEGLAEAIGRVYGWPVLSHHRVFRRHHVPQSLLKRKERRKNVKNAFVIEKQYVNKRKILLVDDVATTGATLEELARTLKAAGADAVFCWALSHPPMKK
ncbi:ComF family protein [Neisseria montereyensis]|uniref:ComF family protein n=1 Tax=Neisseria montereyensis TaxID=2973938 RepID=A0ABT2FCK2_9NEIS|nr:ComF family protein [Neisseria montereyensis]MCS4533931.1 ComF family protein [Neisseria montereyensis]